MFNYEPTLVFSDGDNKLPQVYNPTVFVSAQDPQVRIVVSAEPHEETAPGQRSSQTGG